MGDFLASQVLQTPLLQLHLVDVQSGESLLGSSSSAPKRLRYQQNIVFGEREYQLEVAPATPLLQAMREQWFWIVWPGVLLLVSVLLDVWLSTQSSHQDPVHRSQKSVSAAPKA
jgi:CHASE1-domain containing sensor protein